MRRVIENVHLWHAEDLVRMLICNVREQWRGALRLYVYVSRLVRIICATKVLHLQTVACQNLNPVYVILVLARAMARASLAVI